MQEPAKLCYTPLMTPITQTCPISGQQFLITEKDRAFYQSKDVPLPTLHPEERRRQRLLWRNDKNFYTRKCDATEKPILAMYDKSVPFPVYSNEYWWSDQWDPMTYGMDFDFKRPFFEQIAELNSRVPHCALSVTKPSMENSDYCNQANNLKNCYLCFSTNDSEQCLYCSESQACFDCVDSTYLVNCEACYECVKCFNCKFSTYLFYSENSSNCHYSRALIGCTNCFGCTNLRNKEYYFFNQKCSKEEWEQKVKEFKSGKTQKQILAEFLQFSLQYPVKTLEGKNNENCIGDRLYNSKDCTMSFELWGCENSNYCNDIKRGHEPNTNNYDISFFGVGMQNCYESAVIGGNANNVNFCTDVWNGVSDLYYSILCMSSSDLFGCIGLRNKKFCIFNKQYSKEDYMELKSKIINYMKETGEWGQFFPIKMAPHAYNRCLAQTLMPIQKEDALRMGFKWSEDDAHVEQKDTAGTVICELSGKPFRLTPQELSFYKKMELETPKIHPNKRYDLRRKVLNPYKLWQRSCAKTGKEIWTSYAPDRPDRPEIVYSEAAYLEEVY